MSEEKKMRKVHTTLYLNPSDATRVENTDTHSYIYLFSGNLREEPEPTDRNYYPKTPARVIFDDILGPIVAPIHGLERFTYQEDEKSDKIYYFLQVNKDILDVEDISNVLMSLMAFAYLTATLYGSMEDWPTRLFPSEVESKDYPYWGVCFGMYAKVNGIKIPFALPYMKTDEGFKLIIPNFDQSFEDVLLVVAPLKLDMDLIRAEQDPEVAFYPIKTNPYEKEKK